MKIKRIKVFNFKTFKELDLELGDFNVLIGPNASGKSNFVQILKFLRDICRDGLDNAVSMQGGTKYLRNIKIQKIFKIELIIEYIYSLNLKHIENKISHHIITNFKEIKYKFDLAIESRKNNYKIISEEITFYCDFTKDGINSKGSISLDRNGKRNIYCEKPEIKIDEGLYLFPLQNPKNIKDLILINRPILTFLDNPMYAFLNNIKIHNFEPKYSKRAVPITGKAELEEDGSNLSLVLKNIMEDNEKRMSFLNFIKYILPFVTDIGLEKFIDRSLIFKLKEKYFNKYIPASFLSDGTINIIALIIALYFQNKPFLIIEEPEKNLHPQIIPGVIELIKEASKNTQIIITTHNPEVVKHAGIENLLCVSRDNDGFSKIVRPADSEYVKTFLKNEIGIDELHIQNLLSI